MKSIFAFIFSLFVAISSSFSQSDSLMASAEIPAIMVGFEKDTTNVVIISECDPFGEMSFSEFIETDCALLPMLEAQEFLPIENVDSTRLPLVIPNLIFMEKLNFSVSDIEHTPVSVQEFVESVNDSTMLVAETDSGLVALNSVDELEKYQSIIVADTIQIDDKIFVFDSTQVSDIKNFLTENYFFGDIQSLSISSHNVSGYTEAEEEELLVRWEEREEMAEDKKETQNVSEILAETPPARPIEVYYFVSPWYEETDFVFADFSKKAYKDELSGAEKMQDYSTGTIIFIVVIVAIAIMFLFAPILVVLFGKEIIPYLSHSGKRLVVKWEAPFMRNLRRKRKPYRTEPAEEGARAPSS